MQEGNRKENYQPGCLHFGCQKPRRYTQVISRTGHVDPLDIRYPVWFRSPMIKTEKQKEGFVLKDCESLLGETIPLFILVSFNVYKLHNSILSL